MSDNKIKVLISGSSSGLVFSPIFREHLLSIVSDIQKEYPDQTEDGIRRRIIDHEDDFLRYSQVVVVNAIGFGLHRVDNECARVTVVEIPEIYEEFITISDRNRYEEIQWDVAGYYQHLRSLPITPAEVLAQMDAFIKFY